MKHRAVVASYIFAPSTPPDSTAPTRVALFRRSHHPNIRSYRGLLAPISGSIEALHDASSTAAAARELREETTLRAGTDLRLDAVGPPFSFVDEEAGRRWTVYPFGWTLLCGEGRVVLDWEHEGWEWVEVREVLGGDADGELGLRERCIPRVEESLRRVYFGDGGGVFGGEEQMRRGMVAGDAFYAGMAALRDDKENGARVLATRAVQCLRDILQGFSETLLEDESSRQCCWTVLRIVGWHLVYSARPSMNAAIGSAVVEALASIQHMVQDGGNTGGKVTGQIEDFISKRQGASTRLAEEFCQYAIRQTGEDEAINIVTLSSSSTIKATLLQLIQRRAFKSISISILESRPRCEGARLAASLISALKSIDDSSASTSPSATRVSITIAPDSHLSTLFSQAAPGSERTRGGTYLLLGADRISPHGAVLNKTLSLSAATLAKTLSPGTSAGTVVVVLAETDKLARITDLDLYREDEARSEEREMRSHEAEHGGADEVMDAWLAAGVAESDRRLIQDALAGESRDEGAAVTVSVQNETFEWVPARLVDVYITERGEIKKSEFGELCMKKTELETAIFTSLYD